MNCENFTYLEIEDFNCVGNVAKHCNLNKLCIATEEAKVFDLHSLFCYDFIEDVLTNWNSEDAKYKGLICGGSFTGCNDKKQYSLGLKKVWVYYSYARYLLINRFSDTANGTVIKQNDFSIPMDVKDVTDFSNKYRAMGKEAFNSVHNYLCANKADFPLFNDCNCMLDCGCEGECGCSGQTKKLTGFKFKTISK